MNLTSAQWGTVAIVYLASAVPAAVLLYLYVAKKLPKWLFAVYVSSFIACALGWEIWLTYGLVDGLDVSSRRPEALSAAIPLHINWMLNSLGDAAAVGLVGVLLVWVCYGRTDAAFRSWRWGAFTIFLLWFVGQNLLVELYVYQEQLAEGFRLSWAPLIPTGPWYNPTLFQLGGRTVQLQTQLPWLLMTPLYYGLVIGFYNRFNGAHTGAVPGR
jgi:hypothetical protein